MGHKCFISFKWIDKEFKQWIQNNSRIDMIDKSLNEPINSTNEDYILRKIRLDYLSDSTVTIFLIGSHSAEKSIHLDQTFIKRELQASLYDGQNNTKSGIVGIVLPMMYSKIYLGKYRCNCGEEHENVKIDDDTVIKEFSYNYYIPKSSGCSWRENDRYCVLVKWDDFCVDPNQYIELAFNKRTQPISKFTKVRPI